MICRSGFGSGQGVRREWSWLLDRRTTPPRAKYARLHSGPQALPKNPHQNKSTKYFLEAVLGIRLREDPFLRSARADFVSDVLGGDKHEEAEQDEGKAGLDHLQKAGLHGPSGHHFS